MGQGTEGDETPPIALDETRSFLAQFTDTSDTQLDAVTLWVAHTHALEQFVTTPRLLITSEAFGCGKTELLRRIQDLSRKGWNAQGTAWALKSKLGEPEKATLCIDEISDVFGRSGRSGSMNKLGTILRMGYKINATDSFSENRTVEEVDIFAPAAMAGRGAAAPRDIRDRSVIIKMAQGRPRSDYLVREHDPQAAMLREALGQWVTQHTEQIGSFRCRGLHPKLYGRRREVWEPLFAVAAAGGIGWLRRALTAYLDLALDDSDLPKLTPQQTVLRDMARAAQEVISEGGCALGCALGADLRELMRGYEEPMYETMPDRSLSMAMAAVVPDRAQKMVTVGDRRGRGYVLRVIEAEWEARKPRVTEAELAEADNGDPDAVVIVPEPKRPTPKRSALSAAQPTQPDNLTEGRVA